ncbi:MAG: hypothetical protein AB1351_02350 [Thermoproteota archaeon]
MSKDIRIRRMIRNVEFAISHPSVASDGDTAKLSYTLRSKDRDNLPDRITVSLEINMGSQTLTLRNSFASLPIESSFEIGPITNNIKMLTNVALHFKDQTVKHSLTTDITPRKSSSVSVSIDNNYATSHPKTSISKKTRILNYALILCVIITGIFLARGIIQFFDGNLALAGTFAGYAYYSLFFAIVIFLGRMYLTRKDQENMSTDRNMPVNIKE